MTRSAIALPCALLILCAASATIAEERGVPSPPRALAASAGEPAAAQKVPDAATEAADPGEARPTWYAQALAQGPGGLNVTNFWSKGSKLRAETVVAGHKVVTLVNGEWYTAYDATRGHGIRVRRAPQAIAKDAPYRRPFGNETVRLIQQGAEKIREEEFHGREAEVYQLTDRLGRRTIWTTKDALNIPLRVEMYNRNTASQKVTDYTDWLTGLALADGYFEPDSRIAIETYELEEYLEKMATVGAVGPVPVLYTDLLRGW